MGRASEEEQENTDEVAKVTCEEQGKKTDELNREEISQ